MVRYNSITTTGIYPDSMKISKIVPLLKPNKNKFTIEGYRPINLLGPIDKIYQEHIKINLNDFLELNQIISPKHHGGRKGYGTTTSLTVISDKLYQNKETI